MTGLKRIYSFAYLLAAVALLANTAVAQKRASMGGRAGNAVMWESVNIKRQDLFFGPGGQAMQPDLSRITFISEEKGGHSKKYKIKDGSGMKWVA